MIRIAGREIGKGKPVFLIAEAGVNHNGDPELALAMVDEAAEAGVDAIKFQTFVAEKLASHRAPKASYQIERARPDESQLEMLRRLELPRGAYGALMKRCEERGLVFLSSVFDEESSDWLEQMGIAAFKIPSGELTNPLLLSHVARKGKPLLVSTGMATLAEVDTARQVIERAGKGDLVLLHAVSRYPAPAEEINLRALGTLDAAFGYPVGYSDHSEGIDIAIAAAALGACVIEKHFTLSREMEGPDHRASLEPAELKALARGVRRVEAALGNGRKEPTRGEREIAACVRKSLVAARRLRAGERLDENMITLRRPGTGLAATLLPDLLGRKVRREVPQGDLLDLKDLE
jgi:N-acetylneuraminate synthase